MVVSTSLKRRREATQERNKPVAQLVVDATGFPSGVAAIIAGYQASGPPLRVTTTGVCTDNGRAITVTCETPLHDLNSALAAFVGHGLHDILLYRQGDGYGATDLGPNRTDLTLETVGDVYDPALNVPGTLALHTSFRHR
jgi:hypothetical protein